MAPQTSFEERLKRLQQNAGASAQTAPAHTGGGGGGFGGGPSGSPGRGGGRSGGGGLVKWIMVFILVFVVGMGYLLFYTVQQTTGQAGRAPDYVAANLQGQTVAPKAPGLLQSILGFFQGSEASKPIDFLPDPQQGWVRVTQDDTKLPDILEQISASWPAGQPAVSEHLGFRNLDHFVTVYRQNDIEEQVLSDTRTRAMYLHPNGDFLSVSLRFLSERQALGPADTPDGWISTWTNRAADDLVSGEIFETATFGAFKGVNRTKPAGQSLIARPIAERPDIPNGIKVAIPISHRIVIQLEGVAEARWVTAFLDSMDTAALQTRFE
jgi:hypothetical protein